MPVPACAGTGSGSAVRSVHFKRPGFRIKSGMTSVGEQNSRLLKYLNQNCFAVHKKRYIF
ncbi:hypothetical protein D3OALGA1CA_1865 [Olavius algarvensis associated proteobacterium Delta 3]|nr:hypothetical protein D3OALGA1CA_1865 [Olavius algarvensis associated proteobacterium Delta 3]